MKVGGVPPFEASEYRLKGRSYSKARKTLPQEVVFVPSWFFVSWLFIRMFPQFLLFFFLGGLGVGVWKFETAAVRAGDEHVEEQIVYIVE